MVNYVKLLGINMKNYWLIIFWLAISSHASNEFYRIALETISHGLRKELHYLSGDIEEYPESYFHNAVMLYDVSNKLTSLDPLCNKLKICLNLPYGLSVLNHDGTTITIYENHDIFINSTKIKSNIDTKEEIDLAIEKNRWLFIQLLLIKIALKAEVLLLQKNDYDKINIIKNNYTVNNNIALSMRQRLLLPFIESDHWDLINWALSGPLSKETREQYAEKLIIKYLSNNSPKLAEHIANNYLDKKSLIFDKACQCLYLFYLKNNNNNEAENILQKMFLHSSQIKHQLIKELFLSYLYINDIFNCELCLHKYFREENENYNELIKILIDHFTQKNQYDEARNLLTRHIIDYINYLKRDRKLLEEQVMYLKSKKK